MIKNLLLDYLDDTLKPKTVGHVMLHDLVKCFAGHVSEKPNDLEQYDYFFDEKAALEANTIPQHAYNHYQEMLKKDPGLIRFVMGMQKYKETPHKNYIVSRPLTQVMEKIDINITCEMLPNLNTYFEYTDLKDYDESKVLCVWACIYNLGDIRTIKINYLTDINMDTALSKDLNIPRKKK